MALALRKVRAVPGTVSWLLHQRREWSPRELLPHYVVEMQARGCRAGSLHTTQITSNSHSCTCARTRAYVYAYVDVMNMFMDAHETFTRGNKGNFPKMIAARQHVRKCVPSHLRAHTALIDEEDARSSEAPLHNLVSRSELLHLHVGGGMRRLERTRASGSVHQLCT